MRAALALAAGLSALPHASALTEEARWPWHKKKANDAEEERTLQEPASQAPASEAEPPQAPDSPAAGRAGRAAPPTPRAPGCYVWLPSGCPGVIDIVREETLTFAASINTSAWLRDQNGEQQFQAHVDPAACNSRLLKFKETCKVDDAQVAFVGESANILSNSSDAIQVGNGSRRDASSPDVGVITEQTHNISLPGEARESAEEELAPMMDVQLPLSQEGSTVGAADVSQPSSSKMPQASVRELPSSAPEVPEHGGCYVWTPSGCPRQPAFHASVEWKQDKWGEEHKNAGIDKAGCMSRASTFSSWCGVDDVVMLLVPPTRPPSPLEAGCYAWYPSGCKKKPSKEMSPQQWKRDSWGELHMRADTNETKCLTRKQSFDSWCGTDDVEMLWLSDADAAEAQAKAAESTVKWDHTDAVVTNGKAETSSWGVGQGATAPTSSAEEAAPPVDPQAEMPVLPTEAGCYVWLPTGCAKQSSFKAHFHWRRDTWGEANALAAGSVDKCQARKDTFDRWCGGVNAVMHFVPLEKEQQEQPQRSSPGRDYVAPPPRGDEPAGPGEPGCYVWQPSGCPLKRVPASSEWKHDRWAEDNTDARTNPASCQQRKAKFDSFCGTADARMLYVAEEAVTTTEFEEEDGPGPGAKYADSSTARDTARELSHARKARSAFPLQDGPGPGAKYADSSAARDTARELSHARKARSAFPLQEPTAMGCYVWSPSGCPRQGAVTARSTWQRDVWGEDNKGAGSSQDACNARKASFERHCGVQDVMMKWVPPPRPAEPSEPGCYVWHPSGCPSRRDVKVANEWKHDIMGETHAGAKTLSIACIKRKGEYDTFCGTSDVEMLFVK